MTRKASKSFANIFLKKAVKYFSVYTMLLIIIGHMLFSCYTLATRLVIDTFTQKVSDGVEQIETQMMRAKQISEIILDEETFRSLVLLKGAPSSAVYQDFKKLQTKFSHWTLATDLISDAYILFRDNPIFLSDKIAADTYDRAYPEYIAYKDWSVEQWRTQLFEGVDIGKFLFDTEIYSAYRSPSNYRGVTWIVSSSYAVQDHPTAVLVFVFDTKLLLSKLLEEKQQDVCQLTLYNSNGEMLFAHGSTETEDDKSSMTISHTSKLGWIHAELQIPKSYFQKNVHSLVSLVLKYTLAGVGVLLLLVLYFTYAETKHTKGLIDLALRHAGTTFTAEDEYGYIKTAFGKMSIMGEEQKQQLKLLKQSVRLANLENLILFGSTQMKIQSESDEAMQSMLSCFCVFLVNISSTKSDCENLFLQLNGFLDKIFGSNVQKIIFSTNQMVCVLPLEQYKELTSEGLQQILLPMLGVMSGDANSDATINIGISNIFSGIENVNEAYKQAKNAVSISSSEAGGCYVYSNKRQLQESKIFDITAQMHLYDAIIAGDYERLEDFFAKNLNTIVSAHFSLEKKICLYYSLLHAIDNAFIEIKNEYSTKHIQIVWPAAPQYSDNIDDEALFQELKIFCIKLADIRNEYRKYKNAHKIRHILEFIQSQYSNPNLSCESIAQTVLVSEKYIYTAVKEETGKSLSKYIEDLRLSKAQEMLLHTDASIGDIWETCGFGSEKTFYRAFTKKQSMPPLQWKNRQKN